MMTYHSMRMDLVTRSRSRCQCYVSRDQDARREKEKNVEVVDGRKKKIDGGCWSLKMIERISGRRDISG